nr:hypothetical protein [Tanacetum cinerariifolium]
MVITLKWIYKVKLDELGAGSGATTLTIEEMTSGAWGSTLGGGESFHEVRVLNCFVQKPLLSAHQNQHEWFR